MKRLAYLVALLLTMSLTFGYVYAAKVTIMHVNDTHANLLPGGPRDAQLKAHIGGIAKMASVVGAQKVQDPQTLLLHAGDLSIGDLFYCKYFMVPELTVLNSLGFNAIELGNHEFDLEASTLQQLLTVSGAGSSTFTKILCANATFSDPTLAELKKMVIPFDTATIHGVKVGYFGLITPLTSTISNVGDSVINSDFTVTAGKAGEMVTTLKGMGCEVVILLSHLGILYDQALVQYVPMIDLIIGGHDHFQFDKPIKAPNVGNGFTYIFQAGAFYENVGKIDLFVTTGKVDSLNYTLIKLDENIPEEPTTAGMLAQLQAGVEATYGPVYSQKLADCSKTLEETEPSVITVGWHDTPVCNLVADAFKTWGKTDIGLTALGFTSHPLYQGTIVAADVYRMMGYGFNTVNALGYRMVKFDILGSDLLIGINYGLSQIYFMDDFLVQASGLEYTYKFYMNPDPYQCVGVTDTVLVNGQPIDPSKKYSVTTTEGMLMFLNLLKIVPENIVAPPDTTEFQVVSGYIAQMQTVVSAKTGRVRTTNTVSVDDNSSKQTISASYPTPCANEVNISFEIKNPGKYTMVVFNSEGKVIDRPINEYFDTGSFTKKISTESIPSGIYSYVLSDGMNRIGGRMVVVK